MFSLLLHLEDQGIFLYMKRRNIFTDVHDFINYSPTNFQIVTIDEILTYSEAEIHKFQLHFRASEIIFNLHLLNTSR